MQDIVAISIAAVAAAYLVRRTWLRVVHGKRDACSSCVHCGPSQAVKLRPLVTIDKLTSSAASPRGAANQDA